MGDDTWDGVGGHPGFGQDSEFFHCNCEGAEAGAMWVCGGCYSVPLTSLLGSERKGFSLPRRGVWLEVMKKTVACGGSATISFIVSGVTWCWVGLFLYTASEMEDTNLCGNALLSQHCWRNGKFALKTPSKTLWIRRQTCKRE